MQVQNLVETNGLLKGVELIVCAILMYARKTNSQVLTLDKNLLSILY